MTGLGPDLLPTLGAALLAGFLGSAHCLGMCGGISAMISVNTGVTALSTQVPLAVAYNTGRVMSYALFGAVVAGVGGVFVSAIPALAGPIRFVSGLIIVLIGLQLAFDWRILAPLERAGSVIWQRIAPFAQRFVPVTSLPRALGLGLLWGWLPCGLVYSALLIAATTAQAGHGALTMLAFGFGTMPAMIMTGVGALALSRWTNRTRRTAGILVVLLGILTLAMPVQNWLLAGDNDASTHMHQAPGN